MRTSIQSTPLTLNNRTIKEKESEKYLGDFLHSGGDTESTKCTVNDRYWRIMSSILEIKTIVEDYRNKKKGGIMTGIDLWEMSVIPSLLNNCGSWNMVDTETFTKLNKLQNTLLRYLLSTPRSTPIPSLPWEFGILPIKFRIIVKKLCLAKHITSLEEGSLAKETYETQLKYSFPGLATDAKQLIKSLNLPDITEKEVCNTYSKLTWKNLVKKTVRKQCENELKNEISKLEKLEKSKMCNEEFKPKEYLK